MKKIKFDLTAIIKYTWYIGITIFVAIYLHGNFDTVVLSIKQVSREKILLSMIALIAGKVCLSLNMKYSLVLVGRYFPFIQYFHIYNISQLGKYIPGNFWHFVGRIGLLKNQGLSFKEIRSSMLLEMGLIITGSFLFGSLLLFFNPDFLKIVSESYLSNIKVIWLLIFIGLLFILVIIGIVQVNSQKNGLEAISIKCWLNVKIFLVQFLIWFFLGISFFFIVAFYLSGLKDFVFTIGLFSFAYLLGFLFILAPAGIGIREFILISGLSFLNIPVDTTISLVGLHRALYIIVEILLAVAGKILFSIKSY